jgi:DNA-binding transcriptional LysR family regulator
LRPTPCILGPASLGGHRSFRKGDSSAAIKVEGRLSARASDGAIAAAVAGLGVVMAPLGACRREVDAGELVRLLPDWEAGSVALNAVFAGGRAAKPSARAFIDYLVRALREEAAMTHGPPEIGEKPSPAG